MIYPEGSKLVIKDHTLPYYTTQHAAPTDGVLLSKLDRDQRFLENNYILGMYMLYLGTYKVGSIQYILLKSARKDVFILMDEDNVEQWAMNPSSMKILQNYSLIIAENPGLTDEGCTTYIGPFGLTLTVSA